MSARWEWFAVVIALAVLALQRDPWAFRSVLLVAVVIVLAAGWTRHRVGAADLRAG
jgi:hypothetical protein